MVRQFERIQRLTEKRARLLIVLVLVVAGAILTVTAVNRPVNVTGPDGNVYEDRGARSAASEHLLGCGNFDRVYRSPAWIATIGILYRAVGRHPNAIRVLLVVIALATGWLIFAMARRLAGSCAGLAAASLFLFSSLVFRFTTYYQYEIPFAFLTTLSGYLLFFVPRRRGSDDKTSRRALLGDIGRAVAAGSILALAALMSPRVLALFPLFIFSFRIRSGWKHALREGAALAIGVSLLLLPWGVRNHQCFGKWIFTTSNGGINLYMGNNAYNPGTGFYLPPEGVRPPHRVDDSAAWYREALSYIGDNPGKTAVRALHKGMRFWNPHYGDQFLVLTLFVIGWVRLIRSKRAMSPGLMWILAVPLVFMLVQMAFYIQVRYMIPALPMVTVVAGAGLCGWQTAESDPASAA